eukprot:CAMPEP_0198264648 /NCGR_PEP_ID=MMETSP1447-20131203/16278_1 /TAXON_ID=420782 /ORGANISM="Chaetoceros dichaeta, Strain CCMP1751" /LENGTH=109 /DNA_ID=CAMNT_0043953649 /DNA_START=275 /DNA_END=604 /DNA_ORIENTATION=-
MLSNFYEDGGGVQLRHVSNSSDGRENNDENTNESVDLHLNCPTCKNPFCVSVEDVLMLRRAVVWRRALRNASDEELSASELREKYYWNETRLSEMKLAETRYENNAVAI